MQIVAHELFGTVLFSGFKDALAVVAHAECGIGAVCVYPSTEAWRIKLPARKGVIAHAGSVAGCECPTNGFIC